MSSPVCKRFAPGLAVVGAIASSCLSQTAVAIPVQPAGIQGTVSFNFLSPAPIDVSTFGQHALSGPSGDLLLDAGLGPSPYITASGTIAPFFFGRSVALARYEVQVVGLDGSVGVRISANGSVSGVSTVTDDIFAGFAMRSLWWLEDTSGFQIAQDGIEVPSMKGAFSNSFNSTVDLDLIANRTYRVNILADIGVRGGSATAFIDPIFSFTGGFASDYSFVFSDGVGNGVPADPNPNPTPVPEPANLGILAALLLPMGFIRKRRRKI